MGNNISVVTGANGYLGYTLVLKLIERGEKVRISTHHERPELAHLDCEKSVGNVCDYDYLCELFEGAETVYHVAGVVDITGKKDKLVWEVNYEGTKKVVAACKKCGVKNLVYVSSVDCIPVKHNTEEIKEISVFNQDEIDGAYGKSKAAATQYVIDSGDENLKCVAVHPSCCIGPNDIYYNNSVCSMITLYDHGLFPVSLSFGAYNFVDVRDVADGMIAAAEKGGNGECYLLCGEVVTVRDFIAILAKINGKKPPRIALNKKTMLRLCPVAGAFLKVLKMPPVVTPLSMEIISQNCNFSIEKARRELGYNPMSAQQSLRDTVEWLKTHPKPDK